MNKRRVAIGVDIGGTNIRAGIVREDGDILKLVSDKIPEKKKDILSKIHEMINNVMVRDISAIGIGIAGPINNATGIIYPPNIKELNKVNIVKEMNKYNTPISIENDGNCFSFAEYKVGAAKKHKNILGIAIGTGIGCGIIINGNIYSGRDGAAGEIGHIVIDLNAKSVGRGIPGSFENLASGTAITRRADELIKGNKSILKKGSLASEIITASKKGDKIAKKVVADTGKYLGIGLASLINVFNPDVIVLGGTISKYISHFDKNMKHEISKRGMMPAKRVKIIKSTLEEPGLVGAALVALDKL